MIDVCGPVRQRGTALSYSLIREGRKQGEYARLYVLHVRRSTRVLNLTSTAFRQTAPYFVVLSLTSK